MFSIAHDVKVDVKNCYQKMQIFKKNLTAFVKNYKTQKTQKLKNKKLETGDCT